jgi:hypothetical protein
MTTKTPTQTKLATTKGRLGQAASAHEKNKKSGASKEKLATSKGRLGARAMLHAKEKKRSAPATP